MTNSLIENWTNYSMRLRKTVNPDFFKIRNLSSEFVTKLPQEAQNELYNEMNRGALPLGSEPEMSMYMFAYGKMHYEKLLRAFEQIPTAFFENQIEIIDYGCGQAMGLIAYADFIRQKGYSQKITNITLIEPSNLTISRAILHANQIFPNVTVNAVCKSLDDLEDTDIQTDASTTKLHIFSNIIDVELFSISQLSDFIKQKFDGNNQFVCVSPFFGSTNSRANRLDEFMNLIATSNVYSENLGKNEWINGWTCSIRVYAMLSINFLKTDESTEKVKLLYLNAEKGDPTSQVNLGVCYFTGDGVEKNYNEAYKWNLLAAKQGDIIGLKNIGICCTKTPHVG
ncbi:MAG: tetratricopeptide repeat protein [Bacteroidales bacterium]